VGYGAPVTSSEAGPPRPYALVVCGPPASGKSTVGAELARALGAALLDQDTVTGPLTAVVARLLGSDDLDGPALAEATRLPRYETLTAAAEDSLRCGVPVVLVAPYTTERRDPAAWRFLADRLAAAGGDPVLVWLRLPADELLRRMRDRAAPRDRPKLTDPTAFLSRTDLTPPTTPHLPLDATTPPPAQPAALLAALAAR
jgi:predicted kinase